MERKWGRTRALSTQIKAKTLAVGGSVAGLVLIYS